MARTLQPALQEGAESFPNIKRRTLGTRSGVPQPLLEQPMPVIWSSERWRRSETLDSVQTETS